MLSLIVGEWVNVHSELAEGFENQYYNWCTHVNSSPPDKIIASRQVEIMKF